MKKNVFQGGAAYSAPICEVLTVVVEGSILTTSPGGSLGDLDDNDIYTEEF